MLYGFFLQVLVAVCATDAAGFCTDRVVQHALLEADLNPVVRINMALGMVTIVEFAGDGMAVVDAVSGNSAWLSTTLEADGRRLRLDMHPPKGQDVGQVKASDFVGLRTNVQIELEGGRHVTLQLRGGEEHEAVERLVFSFPERQAQSEWARKLLTDGFDRLRKEYKTKEEAQAVLVRELAGEQIARDMLGRFQCRELRRREMRDLVAIEADRICRIGDRVYISFTLRNRSRSLFVLDELSVKTAKGEKPKNIRTPEGKDVQAVQVEFASPTRFMAFDGWMRGVATVAVSDASTEANVFRLEAIEAGGRGRKVALDELGL